MKIKSLIALITLVLSLSSSAAIGKDELIGSIKGRYILQTNEVGDIHFLIRSSGKLEVTKSDWYSSANSVESYPSKISIEQGDNGLLRGMPVAHLIFSEGSDEQEIDCHILLTAEQGWDGNNPSVRLLSSFILENDAPNDVATVITTKLSLLKYNHQTKDFQTVK